jgi:hypothetical protein
MYLSSLACELEQYLYLHTNLVFEDTMTEKRINKWLLSPRETLDEWSVDPFQRPYLDEMPGYSLASHTDSAVCKVWISDVQFMDTGGLMKH